MSAEGCLETNSFCSRSSQDLLMFRWQDFGGATLGGCVARAAVIAASLRLERSHSLGGGILMNGHTYALCLTWRAKTAG
ncbi:hypothetical protein METHPM2_1560005 [Pseudomonas sp. PM2]